MFFAVSFYIALCLCILGLIYRISKWFSLKIGPDADNFMPSDRFFAFLKGFIKSLFSPGLFILIRVLVLDIILQIPILKINPIRWFMHICIYWSFMLLLLMHALDRYLTISLFPEYSPTLNPFLFLRNLFGLLIIIGILIAIYRRITSKHYSLPSNRRDIMAIILLALIMISGFFLEAQKIVSPAAFDRMAEDFALFDSQEEALPLKLYWAKEFGVQFPDLKNSGNKSLLQEGIALHQESCAMCHSRPNTAFISYPLSKTLKPYAASLDKVKVSHWLWIIHFLACFIGLAFLPFTKFFHIISSTIYLLSRSVTKGNVINESDISLPNLLNLRALAFDACTHCGTCSRHCSVLQSFRKTLNENILPSEKLIAIKSIAGTNGTVLQAYHDIQEGSFICTCCHRCTDLCPAGINLQDLWLASRSDLAEKGLPDPVVWTKNDNFIDWQPAITDKNRTIVPNGKFIRRYLSQSTNTDTFSSCFGCQVCTNSCPIVAEYSNPGEILDMMPHQIMHSLGLGSREFVLGSRMIWDCLTCYQCQESCPQSVRVTDIFYELKNLAYARVRGGIKEKDSKELNKWLLEDGENNP